MQYFCMLNIVLWDKKLSTKVSMTEKKNFYIFSVTFARYSGIWKEWYKLNQIYLDVFKISKMFHWQGSFS